MQVCREPVFLKYANRIAIGNSRFTSQCLSDYLMQKHRNSLADASGKIFIAMKSRKQGSLPGLAHHHAVAIRKTRVFSRIRQL
jgi:hypothetical protein